jgi:hypothetical protein
MCKVCGCVVTCGVAQTSEHEPRIVYCPLHSAAPALKAALEEIIAEWSPGGIFDDGSHPDTFGITLARAALRAATQQEG